MSTQGSPGLRGRIRVLGRSLLLSVGALGWVSAACAPKEDIVPIIHVSPGFENRLALRPPTGSAYADAAAQQAADAGAADTK